MELEESIIYFLEGKESNHSAITVAGGGGVGWSGEVCSSAEPHSAQFGQAMSSPHIGDCFVFVCLFFLHSVPDSAL